MKKITEIKNWFKILRLGKSGVLKATTFRQVAKDIRIVTKQLETTVGFQLYGKQYDTQRMRVEIMIQMMDQAEEILLALVKNNSEHNCFRLRWRIEHLKSFLLKYSKLLNTYNNKFLEKVHGAIELSVANGLIVHENLIIKGDGEIEIIK